MQLQDITMTASTNSLVTQSYGQRTYRKIKPFERKITIY